MLDVTGIDQLVSRLIANERVLRMLSLKSDFTLSLNLSSYTKEPVVYHASVRTGW